MGYPCPGSFGTKYGVEQNLEVITLESPYLLVEEPAGSSAAPPCAGASTSRYSPIDAAVTTCHTAARASAVVAGPRPARAPARARSAAPAWPRADARRAAADRALPRLRALSADEPDGRGPRGDRARAVRARARARRVACSARPRSMSRPRCAIATERAPSRPTPAHELRRHHRRRAGDARALRAARQGRAVRRDGADPGRERHRQGAGRARDPRSLRAPRAPVRRHELLGVQRQPARLRAVRPQARRVHRRGRRQARPVRDRRRRHVLPRRDRRHVARRCRSRSCACSRRARSTASATPRRARSTSASSPRRTATSRAMVEAGQFREDLYYRINVINVHAARAARARATTSRS